MDTCGKTKDKQQSTFKHQCSPMERFKVRPARVLNKWHCDFGGADVWFT